MGDLSRNFNRKEFACECGCGFDTVDVALVELLEEIRGHFAAPIRINSSCRCAAHNSQVGGGDRSQHLYGRAADIVVDNCDPADVHAFAESLNPGGLGKYDTFTHVDTRTAGPARW